ncbi:hypothetical protein HanXRQr2_Chr10g0451921 [Helianthus annuus]|uniref:Thioredoxin-like fold protein n=1 Tax=Helianthus annuus TaxID=4232 RepID=A0A9K3HZL8_HELAN|nr:hypothetical protein HanXRQr2_Chr10g0451921 [Helianthus annuus]
MRERSLPCIFLLLAVLWFRLQEVEEGGVLSDTNCDLGYLEVSKRADFHKQASQFHKDEGRNKVPRLFVANKSGGSCWSEMWCNFDLVYMGV